MALVLIAAYTTSCDLIIDTKNEKVLLFEPPIGHLQRNLYTPGKRWSFLPQAENEEHSVTVSRQVSREVIWRQPQRQLRKPFCFWWSALLQQCIFSKQTVNILDTSSGKLVEWDILAEPLGRLPIHPSRRRVVIKASLMKCGLRWHISWVQLICILENPLL